MVLEELQGVRGVEPASDMRAWGRSRPGKGGHRPGGRMGVRRVPSGFALGGEGELQSVRKLPRAKKEVFLNPTLEADCYPQWWDWAGLSRRPVMK